MRQLIAQLRTHFGRALPLEFRMDAAFFQQNLLKLLIRQGCFYTVKVPCCQWTGVEALVAAQSHWSPLTADINCFDTRLALAAWGLELRVVVYRKRVHHQSASLSVKSLLSSWGTSSRLPISILPVFGSE